MKDSLAQKISERTGVNKTTVKAIVSELGRGIYEELRAGDKHRIVITKFMRLASTAPYINYQIKERLIQPMRWAKENDPETYEEMKPVFRRLWEMKQDYYRFMERKNGRYYPSKEQKDAKTKK